MVGGYSAILEKYILRLHIPVENLLLMQVVQREPNLYQPLPDLLLLEVLLLGGLYVGVHVSAVAVHHNDVEVLVAIDEGVLVGDNVWVRELLEQFDLNELVDLAMNVPGPGTSCMVAFRSFSDISLILTFLIA